ncbi:MAG: S-methyl-5-thioribose-1-phosphate isomerase [Acidobacteria bacterium]|nr:MAG: S-methyl-5-thioribose-1-phosphate isomerase [Acidobacteriota bacterium]
MAFETMAWNAGEVVLIDQRRLPGEEIYLRLKTAVEVAEAIRDMVVRGAPAIGVTACMGLALGATQLEVKSRAEFNERFADLGRLFAATRPTARNLFWAVARMQSLVAAHPDKAPGDMAAILVAEGERVKQEDLRACHAMGRHGAALLEGPSRILTHCNAGGLATAGYGTALGIIRAAHAAGNITMVYADETRPFLQGARLTAWELHRDLIPVTLITDSMSGLMMRRGNVDAVVVGSDRIAANGDVANKIGTYLVAVAARDNNIPFYVAAPTTTVDLDTPTGDTIPIEERDPDEITMMGGVRLAPEGIQVANPAFDITPARLVTAIITETGVARPPYTESLAALVAAAS